MSRLDGVIIVRDDNCTNRLVEIIDIYMNLEPVCIMEQVSMKQGNDNDFTIKALNNPEKELEVALIENEYYGIVDGLFVPIPDTTVVTKMIEIYKNIASNYVGTIMNYLEEF